MHQLDIGYPESSLAMERPVRQSGIHAGDRAPDAPVRGAGGQQTRLFSLFAGPHWTLLVGYEVGGTSRPTSHTGLHIHVVGERGDLVDDRHHLRNAYGLAAGDWVLVRPDGYIGAIVGSEELGALESYLNTMLSAQAS